MFLRTRFQFTVVAILAAAGSNLRAVNLTLSGEVRVQRESGGERMPRWSGGSLQEVLQNKSAAPLLLSYDERGKEILARIFSIPEAETIDIVDFARGGSGRYAVCGSAYDHSGRGSGFIASFRGDLVETLVVRTDPYTPFKIAVGPDSTIWTAGLELVNRSENGAAVHPEDGVLRHFGENGKQLAAYIPRSELSAAHVVTSGFLDAAGDRVAWCTGPLRGEGAALYVLDAHRTVRRFPALPMTEHDGLMGFAVTDDGTAFLTTHDNYAHSWRLLSVKDPDQGWSDVQLSADLKGSRSLVLYGATHQRLVFGRKDRYTLAFAE
jgi:hypothetical protein